MAKQNNYEDPRLNTEFDNIYKTVDLIVVSITQPTNPRMGMMWINPKDQTFKIWMGEAFISF